MRTGVKDLVTWAVRAAQAFPLCGVMDGLPGTVGSFPIS